MKMIPCLMRTAVFGAAAALSFPVLAQCPNGTVIGNVQVLHFSGQNNYDLCSNASSITVPLATTSYQVNITTNGNATTSTNVPRVVLSGSSSLGINVVAGGVTYQSTDTIPLKLKGNWGGLEKAISGGATVLLYGGVEGNLTGAVYADTISRFDVGGTMNNTIHIGASGGLNVIEMGSFGSSGYVLLTSGVSLRVRVNSGDFAGDLEATSGTFNQVTVVSGSMTSTSSIKALGGAVGDVTVSGSISASEISARDGIKAIDATGGAINSTIRANASSGAGVISRLTSASGGFAGSLQASAISGGVDTDGIKLTGTNANLSASITISGNALRQVDIAGNSTGAISIAGSLNTGNASRLLRVGGTASGAITISGSVSTPVSINSLNSDLTIGDDILSGGSVTITNGLGASRILTIGGSLAGSINLTPSTNALQGQIIINADNTGGTWTGTVNVGSMAITAPTNGEYTQVSTDLGGGAVGRAPFRLYATDCTPQNNLLTYGSTTITTTHFNAGGGNSATPIKVRFYGPVSHGEDNMWDDVTVIECKPLIYATNPCSTGAEWADVSQGFLVRGPESGTWEHGPRTIGISRADSNTFVGPGIYRIKFTGVLCNDLNVSGVSVAATTPCSGGAAYYFRVGPDCNENSVDDENPSDIAPGQCSGGCGDFNHDGTVAVDDIFAFLTAWFAGCDGTQLPPFGPGDACRFGSADFNDVGGLTVADIFAFLTAWFQGPTAC